MVIPDEDFLNNNILYQVSGTNRAKVQFIEKFRRRPRANMSSVTSSMALPSDRSPRLSRRVASRG